MKYFSVNPTIMKLLKILFTLLWTLLLAVVWGQDLPYQLNLEEGATYYMDLRIEPDNIHVSPKRTERILYRIEVLEETENGNFLIELEIERLQYYHKYMNDRISFFDSDYHLANGNENLFSKQRQWQLERQFLLEIDPWGAVVQNRGVSEEPLVKGKLYMPSSPNTFFWLYGAPKSGPNYLPGEVFYQRAGTSARHLKKAEARRAGNIAVVDFGRRNRMAIDLQTGWLKYGYFEEEVKIGNRPVLKQSVVSFTGWKEENDWNAVVCGQLENERFKPEELARKIERQLAFHHHIEAKCFIEPDGRFRLETHLKRPVYIQLDFIHSSLGEQKIYIQAGDSLYVKLDKKDERYDLHFSGNCSAEQDYLRRFYQNTTWPVVQIESLREQVKVLPMTRSDFKNFVQPTPADFLQQLQAQYERDQAFLQAYQDELDPHFYQSQYWELKYRTADELLKYYNFLEPFNTIVDLPDEFLDMLENLPVINDQAESSEAYFSFLKGNYLHYRRESTRNFNRSQETLFYENYFFARLIYDGYPLFRTLYEIIRDGIADDQMVYSDAAFSLMDDFYNICEDDEMRRALDDINDRYFRVDPGDHLWSLPFRLEDEEGRAFNWASVESKKILLHVFNTYDAYFNQINFNALQYQYPGLRVIHLCTVPRDEWERRLRPEQETPEDTEFLFVEDWNEGWKAHDFFHVNPVAYPSANYERLYLFQEDRLVYDYFNRWDADASNYLPELQDKIHELMQEEHPNKQERKKWALIILVNLVFGSALIWGVSFWRTHYIRRREQRRRQLVELELKSLRAQLNPHFVFNTMSSIQNMIVSEQPELANQYLAELASLMRLVLRHTQKGVVTLAEELEAIRQYCRLENLRKPFDLSIKLAAEVDPYIQEIPAMLLQPYVENALKHGLSGQKERGKLEILIWRELDCLEIRIQDNGIGFGQTEHIDAGGNGMGLMMTQERLRLLYGQAAYVRIDDLSFYNASQNGTRVDIHLPIEV